MRVLAVTGTIYLLLNAVTMRLANTLSK